MASGEPVLVRCFAKVNPVLLVGPRRPDGYHELDLEFLPVELHDTLAVAPAEGFRLEVDGAAEGVPVAGNLVLRAAMELRSELGTAAIPGASFTLSKRIPAAAGLGGGSSDAAGALLGLVRLHGLSPPEGLLADVALRVGSDVPYFLRSGRWRGRGRGEVLEPLPDRAPRSVLLVTPRPGLATAEVFAAHAKAVAGAVGGGPPTSLTRGKTGTSFGLEGWWQADPPVVHDDLWPAAASLRPGLTLLRAALESAFPEGQVGLTGSGPTLFVLLPAEAHGADLVRRGAEAAPDAAVVVTRTLSREEHERRRFAPG